MATFTLVDTVKDVTGRSHVTLTNTTEDVPVLIKVVLQEDPNDDLDIRIQSAGIEDLETLGRLISGLGAKLVDDAAAGRYQEED